MDRQNKKQSGNKNEYKRLSNIVKYDNILKKPKGLIGLLLGYCIMIGILILILTLTGCTDKTPYNQDDLNNIAIACNKRINEINETLNLEKQKNKTVINTNTIYIQNSTLGKAKEQRWSLELAWCKSELKLMNETDAYQQLKRNYTNIQYEYEKCNNTIKAMNEIYEKWK